MDIDFKNMQTYHYFMIGGGGLVLIAIILYFLKGKTVKVSAFFATTLGCLAVGFGAGIVTLAALGYNWNVKERPEQPPPAAPPGGMPAGMAPMGGGMGGKGDGANKGGGKKGGGGPSSKIQLVSLVTRLNQLTGPPLKIELNDERKSEVAEQLKDLHSLEELSDDVATQRLNALLDIFKDDRPTLEKAGFSMGGSGLGALAKEKNPFNTDAVKDVLKSMQERVGVKPGPGIKPDPEELPAPRTNP